MKSTYYIEGPEIRDYKLRYAISINTETELSLNRIPITGFYNRMEHPYETRGLILSLSDCNILRRGKIVVGTGMQFRVGCTMDSRLTHMRIRKNKTGKRSVLPFLRIHQAQMVQYVH
jgi:hypothetical protein